MPPRSLTRSLHVAEVPALIGRLDTDPPPPAGEFENLNCTTTREAA